MVVKQSSNSLLLKPAGSDLSDYEIIISNINPVASIAREKSEGGIYVQAGANIGYSAGSNGCKDDHIHVAMRKKANSESGCFYLDPSPFLNSLKLIPKWTQMCKDFNFRHIGQLFETGFLTEGFKKLLEELKRRAIDYAKGLILSTLKEIGGIPPSLMSSIEGFVSAIGNVVKDAKNLGSVFKNMG